jgi:flagellar FliL protein
MADNPKNEEQVTQKSPMLLILIGSFISVIMSVVIVLATLYFTGFFSDKTELQQEMDRLDAEVAEEDSENIRPDPQLMQTPDPTRLDTLYYQMSSPLTANIQNSRKVMQVTVAIMTHYDQMVIDRVTKHELMIRAAMLATMGNVNETEMTSPTFRQDLEEQLKISANSVLEEQEDFGGIERVLFVEYLVQ